MLFCGDEEESVGFGFADFDFGGAPCGAVRELDVCDFDPAYGRHGFGPELAIGTKRGAVVEIEIEGLGEAVVGRGGEGDEATLVRL